VTHPFHPLCGRDFEFVAYRQNWGEDRVHLHAENGQLFSLPAVWTDATVADPFVVIAAGRCPFTTDGLLAVAMPVGFQNSATGVDLGFYAARSYSLMRPPRTGRRWICSWERSATGWSGRGGRSWRPRWGRRPL
jgi:hypothetical protein